VDGITIENKNLKIVNFLVSGFKNQCIEVRGHTIATWINAVHTIPHMHSVTAYSKIKIQACTWIIFWI